VVSSVLDMEKICQHMDSRITPESSMWWLT